VLFNGTGVFLLALLAANVAANIPRPISQSIAATSLRWIYPALFFLIFPVMTLAIPRFRSLTVLYDWAETWAVEWSEEHPSSVIATGLEKAMGETEWNRVRVHLQVVQQESLENFFPDFSRYGKICDLLGEPWIFPVLARHNALQQGYYYSLTDESPVAEVRRTMSDLHSCTYAILPASVLTGPPPVQPLDLNRYSRLLMFPLGGTPIVPKTPPNRELFAWARTAFDPVQRIRSDGLFLCKRRPEVP
jgi:hypothetical protein